MLTHNLRACVFFFISCCHILSLLLCPYRESQVLRLRSSVDPFWKPKRFITCCFYYYYTTTRSISIDLFHPTSYNTVTRRVEALLLSTVYCSCRVFKQLPSEAKRPGHPFCVAASFPWARCCHWFYVTMQRLVPGKRCCRYFSPFGLHPAAATAPPVIRGFFPKRILS
jgi:hypothetical protein